jgi:Family of unknown function (DUF5989)
MTEKPVSEFERAASQEKEGSILGELWFFLKNNKKWWLLPILILFFLFGLLMLLSGGAATPFIYTLF